MSHYSTVLILLRQIPSVSQTAKIKKISFAYVMGLFVCRQYQTLPITAHSSRRNANILDMRSRLRLFNHSLAQMLHFRR